MVYLRCLSVHLSICTLFPITHPTVFIGSLGGKVDHEVMQRILFRGYITPNFDRVITHFKDFSNAFVLYCKKGISQKSRIEWQTV